MRQKCKSKFNFLQKISDFYYFGGFQKPKMGNSYKNLPIFHKLSKKIQSQESKMTAFGSDSGDVFVKRVKILKTEGEI